MPHNMESQSFTAHSYKHKFRVFCRTAWLIQSLKQPGLILERNLFQCHFVLWSPCVLFNVYCRLSQEVKWLMCVQLTTQFHFMQTSRTYGASHMTAWHDAWFNVGCTLNPNYFAVCTSKINIALCAAIVQL